MVYEDSKIYSALLLVSHAALWCSEFIIKLLPSQILVGVSIYLDHRIFSVVEVTRDVRWNLSIRPTARKLPSTLVISIEWIGVRHREPKSHLSCL